MMEEKQAKLRMRFKAETDLEVTEDTYHEYTNWLEKLRINSLNGELMTENIHFKNTIQKAIDILDEGLTSRHAKGVVL